MFLCELEEGVLGIRYGRAGSDIWTGGASVFLVTHTEGNPGGIFVMVYACSRGLIY